MLDTADHLPETDLPETDLPETGALEADRDPARAADLAAVVHNFTGVVHTFTRAKARMLQEARHDVDRAASVLLRSLGLNGPMRASALADSVQSDPSTISRQIASLVADGLIERRSDPVDGRACLLVPTEAGEAAIARQNEARSLFFQKMLQAWPADDLHQFAALLERFSQAYESANLAWMSERASAQATESARTTTEGRDAR